MDPYPIETQARAALRLTAGWVTKAQAGPRDGATEEQEARRKSFLQVHPAVSAIAERAAFSRDDNGADRRPGLIAALLRIAMISAEAFAVECAAVDAAERGVLAMLGEAIAKLSLPPPPRLARTVSDQPGESLIQARMRFTSCDGTTDPCLAATVRAEQFIQERARIRDGLLPATAPDVEAYHEPEPGIPMAVGHEHRRTNSNVVCQSQ